VHKSFVIMARYPAQADNSKKRWRAATENPKKIS
jgi:hypothetical protein